MTRLVVISLVICTLLSACEPPNLKITDLGQHRQDRDSLIHGTLKQTPPSADDDAKIMHHTDQVILTTRHVLSIKTELYQPSFRLSGIITPINTINVLLPTTSSLDTLLVHDGDTVQKGTPLAIFATYTPTPHADRLVHDDLPSDDGSDDHTHQTPRLTHQTDLITLYAPLTGQVAFHQPLNSNMTYPDGTRLFTIKDDQHLKFVSLLPQYLSEHLTIGSAVNFTTTDERHFTGQIANIRPHTAKNTMEVHVAISRDEIKHAKLQLGEFVGGFVEYGQKSVGVLVPDFALFDDDLHPLDLHTLQNPPFKPNTPLPAFIWTIGQNSKLSLSRVHVIAYRPKSGLYLVDGVNLTGLVVLANLPKDAQGKTVQLR